MPRFSNQINLNWPNGFGRWIGLFLGFEHVLQDRLQFVMVPFLQHVPKMDENTFGIDTLLAEVSLHHPASRPACAHASHAFVAADPGCVCGI